MDPRWLFVVVLLDLVPERNAMTSSNALGLLTLWPPQLTREVHLPQAPCLPTSIHHMPEKKASLQAGVVHLRAGVNACMHHCTFASGCQCMHASTTAHLQGGVARWAEE